MRIILLPLSFLFRIIVYFRNKLYDWNIIKPILLNAKVISVGNIAAGGTGKTPFVEMLAEYILSKGKFLVIIQKGYKRESDDLKVCEYNYKNEDHKLNSENFGDEGLMLLENLNNYKGEAKCLLIVCDKKSSAAKFANSKFKPDVILLDDGFQHRKIARDLDIVIISESKRNSLIPAGRMREPLTAVYRSDVIAVNRKFNGERLPAKTKNIQYVECDYVFEGFEGINSETRMELSGSAVAFCGIAEPDSFRELLKKQNIKLLDFIEFPDHHSFTIQDIGRIMNSFKNHNAETLITTQKDYVRIKNSELVLKSTSDNSYKDLLLNYPLYYAKIKMQISNHGEFLYEKVDKLLELI